MKFIKQIFNLKMCKQFDFAIHLSVISLLIFGSIMVLSATIGESDNQINIIYKTALMQGLVVFITYWGMTILARNFGKWFCKEIIVYKDKKRNGTYHNVMRRIFYFIGFVIIVLLVITLFSAPLNGARSWIILPGIGTIQPSEFAKVYAIVLLGLTVNEWGRIRSISLTRYMLAPGLFVLLSAILIMLQPDFGTLVSYGLIIGLLLLIPTHRNMRSFQKVIFIGFVVASVGFVFLNTDIGIKVLDAFNLGYQFDRFTSAADPFSDSFNTGYNLVYSLYAIAKGFPFGVGLGSSEQKLGYLPEAESDFIFSVMIEELGLLGLFILILFYSIIIYKLFWHAIRCQREGYKIILFGAALYILVHFIINVGGVSGLFPLTGIPLLFISAGNSSLLSIMALMGISQSVIGLESGMQKKEKMTNN